MKDHNMLHPCGTKPDLAVCRSKDHQWKKLFVQDRPFRHCLRCYRLERKENNNWVINEVKPSII
jgi:hypothetical protein